MKHFVRICAGLLLAGSCGAPTAPRIALEPLVPAGTYLMFAETLVNPPSMMCSGGDHYIGVTIKVPVTVTYEGRVLVARSATPADGDFEMRISGSESRWGTALVNGTARGTLVDRADEDSVGAPSLVVAGANGQSPVVWGEADTVPGPSILVQVQGVLTSVSSLGTETCGLGQVVLRKPDSVTADVSRR